MPSYQEQAARLASAEIRSVTIEAITDTGSVKFSALVDSSDFDTIKQIISGAREPYRGGRTFTRRLFRLRILVGQGSELVFLVRLLEEAPESAYISVNNIFPDSGNGARSVPVVKYRAEGYAQWFTTRLEGSSRQSP